MITIEVNNSYTGFQVSAKVVPSEVEDRYEITYTGRDIGVEFKGSSEFNTNKAMSTLDIVEIVTTSIRWDSE